MFAVEQRLGFGMGRANDTQGSWRRDAEVAMLLQIPSGVLQGAWAQTERSLVDPDLLWLRGH
jgi:hypothetical protein